MDNFGEPLCLLPAGMRRKGKDKKNSPKLTLQTVLTF